MSKENNPEEHQNDRQKATKDLFELDNTHEQKLEKTDDSIHLETQNNEELALQNIFLEKDNFSQENIQPNKSSEENFKRTEQSPSHPQGAIDTTSSVYSSNLTNNQDTNNKTLDPDNTLHSLQSSVKHVSSQDELLTVTLEQQTTEVHSEPSSLVENTAEVNDIDVAALPTQNITHDPVAGNVDLSTSEYSALTFSQADLIANSSDVDGDALLVTTVSVAAEFGTITDNGDSTWTFNPAENYNGDKVPVSFTVSDGITTDSATASIDVTSVNDGPVAIDDNTNHLAQLTDATTSNITIVDSASLNLNGSENFSLSISVTPNGEQGNYDIIFNKENTVEVAFNGHGELQFAMRTEDQSWTWHQTDVSYDVNSVNNIQFSYDGENVTISNMSSSGETSSYTQSYTGKIIDTGNDLMVGNRPYGGGRYSMDGNVDNISMAVEGTEVVNLDFDGTKQLVDKSGHGNNAILGQGTSLENGDSPLNATEDLSLLINASKLLINDIDADGDTLSIASVAPTDETHGTVSLDDDGNVVFTPEENYHGEASFQYTVTDGNGGEDEATVTLNVTASNDAPIDIEVTSIQGISQSFTAGAASGVTVTGIYALGSELNILEGAPELETSSSHNYFDHDSLGHTGYNYVGGHHWFSEQGISLNGLRGGKVVFSDGTIGEIDTASDGAGSTESAYIYYHSYGETEATAVENAEAGTVVATLSASDIDDAHAESFTYAIEDNANFEVIGNEIRVKVGADLNYESEDLQALTVSVTDSHGASYTETVHISLQNVNEAPTDITFRPDLENEANLQSGAPSGITVVGLYTSNGSENLLEGTPELETSSSHNYFDHGSLGHTGYNYVGGHHWFSEQGISLNGLRGGKVVFSDGTTGYIDAASDGSGSTESAYIYYRAYDPELSPHINEGISEGAVVTTLTAVDEDTNETLTYSIAENQNFEIDGNQIVIKAGANIDFETAESHEISVQVTDSAGNTFTKNLTINIDDLNEIQGTSGNDTLRGTDSNDLIQAGAGNDNIDARGGTDSVDGGTGDDYIYADGSDTIDGGEGFDSVNFRNSSEGVSTDNLQNVERVYGSDHNDSLSGSSEADQLYGYAGDDTISGGGGNDRIGGGAGNDTLSGGTGNDTVFGEDGNDSYLFTEGQDTFHGGDSWTDTVQLVADPQDGDNPWTITVDGEQVEYDLAAGALELQPDTSGVVEMADGSELTFDGVETIQW